MNPEEFAKHVLPVFVTPVINYRWPDSDALNKDLRSFILTLEQTESGLSKSNVGGWHSAIDLLARDDGAVQQLRERLWQFSHHLFKQFSHTQAVPRFRIEGWANVLRHGQYHSVHAHPNATWSGVYYVTDNGDDQEHPFSGRFELLDPRPAASVGYAELSNLYGRFLLNPNAGQMLVFPSWMQHQVHPYFGTDERITVAFNIVV